MKKKDKIKNARLHLKLMLNKLKVIEETNSSDEKFHGINIKRFYIILCIVVLEQFPRKFIPIHFQVYLPHFFPNKYFQDPY
jgi:hypothetical protein